MFKHVIHIVWVAGLLSGCVHQQPLMQPFSSDGCSLFPDQSIMSDADWCECCVVHDLAYWRGGTSQERLAADKALQHCVIDRTQNHLLAELMFAGVRIGGSAYSVTPYRWGYGRQYGRFNTPLSAEESLEADQLEQAYRAQNPKLHCQAQ